MVDLLPACYWKITVYCRDTFSPLITLGIVNNSIDQSVIADVGRPLVTAVNCSVHTDAIDASPSRPRFLHPSLRHPASTRVRVNISPFPREPKHRWNRHSVKTLALRSSSGLKVFVLAFHDDGFQR